MECRAAVTAWHTLERYIERAGLEALTNITLEEIIGAGSSGTTSKLELTLRAELALRLITTGGKVYCPAGLAKASVRTILMVEKLSPNQKERLELVLGE